MFHAMQIKSNIVVAFAFGILVGVLAVTIIYVMGAEFTRDNDIVLFQNIEFDDSISSDTIFINVHEKNRLVISARADLRRCRYTLENLYGPKLVVPFKYVGFYTDTDSASLMMAARQYEALNRMIVKIACEREPPFEDYANVFSRALGRVMDVLPFTQAAAK